MNRTACGRFDVGLLLGESGDGDSAESNGDGGEEGREGENGGVLQQHSSLLRVHQQILGKRSGKAVVSKWVKLRATRRATVALKHAVPKEGKGSGADDARAAVDALAVVDLATPVAAVTTTTTSAVHPM